MSTVDCLRVLLLATVAVAICNAGDVHVHQPGSYIELGSDGTGSKVVLTAPSADTISIEGVSVLNVAGNVTFGGVQVPYPLPSGTRLQVGVEIPYLNSYHMYQTGDAYENISVAVSPNNMITISGGFQGGPCTANSAVFSLPAPLRPAGDVTARGFSYAVDCRFRMQSNGDFINVDCDNCGSTATDWGFVQAFSYLSVGSP